MAKLVFSFLSCKPFHVFNMLPFFLHFLESSFLSLGKRGKRGRKKGMNEGIMSPIIPFLLS